MESEGNATEERVAAFHMLLYGLRNDLPTLDTLDLTESGIYTREDFLVLLEALERNSRVTCIRLHQSVLNSLNLDIQTRERFFACVKRCLSLKVTAFADCFALILGQHLTELNYSNIVLNGRLSVLLFANKLRHCHVLKVCKLRTFIPLQLRMLRLTDPIFLALADKPLLEYVRICSKRIWSFASHHAIQRMMERSVALRKITLAYIHLRAEHVTVILQNLPRTVRSMTLVYKKHYPESTQEWERFFNSNHSSLRKLTVDCRGASSVLNELHRTLTTGQNTTLFFSTVSEVGQPAAVPSVVECETVFELLMNRKGKKHWINQPSLPVKLLPLLLERGTNDKPSFMHYWLQRSMPEILTNQPRTTAQMPYR